MPATKRAPMTTASVENYRRALLALRGVTPYAGRAGDACHICKGLSSTCSRCHWIKEALAVIEELGHEVEA